MRTFRDVPWIVAALVSAAACLPDIPHHDPPATVEAEFDPSAEPSARIPKPTDLVYDVETGLLALDIEPDDSPIQTDVATFLNSLDGWPASMPGEAAFLGAVDPATIDADTVRVYDITDPGDPRPVAEAERYLETGDAELLVYPGRWPSWEPGRRYAVAILGGEHGVRGAAGETVVPSPTFWFFRASQPIAVCEDDATLTGCRSVTDLVDDEDVADLEEVRRESAEVFDALETAGVPREEIALAWSFRTSVRPVVPFDPSTDDVHFPNDYYLSEDETHVELPLPGGAGAAAAAFLDRVNALDGYSLTAPGWMRFVGPLDGSPANLTPTALLLLNADDDEDMPLARREWDGTRNVVVLDPQRALRPHTRYVAVALDYLADVDGNRIIPSHIWTILRSENPVIDDGDRSLLDGVSDEDAGDLEEARQDYAELFETLVVERGYLRDMIQVGVVFTTQSAAETLPALRRRLDDEALPTAPAAPGGVLDPADVVPPGVPRASIGGVVEGTLPGLDLLDPATREFAAGAGRVVDLPFVLALPVAPPAGRLSPPVVVFQHDLGGARDDMLLVADELCAEGFAVLAIDLVGHGSRGVCLIDGDCDAGTCDAGACSGGALRTDAAGRPANAHETLVPVARPFAVRDTLRQQAVDLAAVARSLRAADGFGSLAGVDIDTTDVSLLGLGFGAMTGAIFLVVEPAVSVAVLVGPGGNLGKLVEGSVAFPAAMSEWLEGDLGLAPGSEAHRLFRYAWSWAADPGDASVYARHLLDAPLDDPATGAPMAPKSLLIQVAPDDDVIPFEAQRFFYLSGGIEVYPTEYPGAGHGFFLDPSDAQGAAARAEAVAFLVAGLGGGT